MSYQSRNRNLRTSPMAIVNANRTVAQHVSGRAHRRTNRRAKHKRGFVSVVLGIGVTVVLAFLLTFALVFLEVSEQWHN
jgi:hypothetical protein